MFYAMPRDVLQTSASLELHRRDWRYHAELRVWLKARSPQELMQGQPNVQYVYFDASAWEARLFTGNARAPLANGFLTGIATYYSWMKYIRFITMFVGVNIQRRIYV